MRGKKTAFTGLFALLALLTGFAVIAQQNASSSASDASAAPPTITLRATTHLVLLDVIAVDKGGRPVTDLKKEDFKVEENGKPENVSMFNLESASAPQAPPERPANIYTNRPAYNMPDSDVTILMIDALNSPFRDQAYARRVMLQYVDNQMRQQPGRQFAVLALGSKLYQLQGFTTDPTLLHEAIEKYKPQGTLIGASSTIAPAHGSSAASDLVGRTGNPLFGPASALNAFATEQSVFDLQYRIQNTLNAINGIGRLVAGKTGRKNLVWLTATLPFSLVPSSNDVAFSNVRAAGGDPNLGGSQAPLPVDVRGGGGESEELAASDVRTQSEEAVKRAAALLASNQVAVYPVDIRGLIGNAANDAGASGSGADGHVITDVAFGALVAGSNNSVEASQAPMDDLAKQTGGVLYRNRNDVENAVAEAASDGATYYEIGYYPDKPKFDGNFHKFRVTVNRPGVQLRYRPGYFAVEPGKENEKERKAELAQAIVSPEQASMILFDALVVPPPVADKMTVPVKMLIRPDTISTELSKDGKHHHVDVDYLAIAFGSNGQQAANVGKSIKADLDETQYAELMQKGLGVALDVPITPGEYTMKLAIRDNPTGYFGTVNVPLDLTKK